MNMNFEEMLNRVTDFLKAEAKSETVIGQQFQLGEFTCVPVIRLGMGFGSGGGEGEAPKQGQGEGGGAGAGLGIEPIGFLVSRGGEISFVSSKSSSGLSKAFEQAPELIEKFLETQRQKELENA
jgi:uncharacterized spore protein YtfJ